VALTGEREGLSGAPASEESSFRKAHDARSRDDEMVEHLNVDQREGGLSGTSSRHLENPLTYKLPACLPQS